MLEGRGRDERPAPTAANRARAEEFVHGWDAIIPDVEIAAALLASTLELVASVREAETQRCARAVCKWCLDGLPSFPAGGTMCHDAGDQGNEVPCEAVRLGILEER